MRNKSISTSGKSLFAEVGQSGNINSIMIIVITDLVHERKIPDEKTVYAAADSVLDDRISFTSQRMFRQL
ncbi:hypothetical protein PAENIP36_02820 [Paenibacillus sp. P36]